MLASIKNVLFGVPAEADVAAGRHSDAALHRAAAGLLVEAAVLDGALDDAERARVGSLLAERFELGSDAAGALIEAAEAAAAESVELYTLSKTVRDHFDHDERIAMIEMLWEVAYADGVLHDYEANMLRRVAGLLYVTDQETGAAKRRVQARLTAE